ncbi:Uncharacterised protein r2_g601 [Pycnogonum litorale]
MDTIDSCGNLENFRFSLQTAGLTDVVKTGGPYTLFAPTDTAFEALSTKLKHYLATNSSAMKAVMKYHMVDGIHFGETLDDGQYLNTLSDNPLIVGIRSSDDRNRLVDVNRAKVLRSDIPARNGVIHIIDRVLHVDDLGLCQGEV